MGTAPKCNVLMLGWEFYPVFVGGMGVITSEIVHGLTDANIGVHFVIPKLPKKIEVEKFHLTSASAYQASQETLTQLESINQNFKKTYLDTVFSPYQGTEIAEKYAWSHAVNDVTNVAISENGEKDVNMSNELYSQNILREIQIFEDKTAQIALESDFDLIHAHDWLTFKAAVKAKNITGKPVILHVHATEIDRSGESPNKIVFDIEQECLKEADYVIAVSHKTKEDLILHYHVDPKKIIVVHNSIQYAQSHQRTILSKQDKIVLFLGRMTMQKGPEYFVQAAAKVLKMSPDTLFVMAGEGDSMPRIIDLVNDLGIEKNFIFTGFVSGEYKNRLFASADLFVMPSVSEPFGIVAIESVRSGTPIIISKTSGAAEIFHNALKVDFWDVDKMANMIYSALHYSSLREELIDNQSHDFDSANWNHQIDVITQIYEMAKSS